MVSIFGRLMALASNGRWRAALLVFAVAFSGTAHSQIVLRSELVMVPVTVRDKKGRFIADLQVEDFTVFDNGRPRPIKFFSFQPDAEHINRPLAMALLLDASRSISTVLHQQRTAVASLLNRLGDGTLLSLISFSRQPDILLDWTADKAEALRAFFSHRRIGGDTAIFDALLFGLAHLRTMSQAEMRKVVVIISDGLDTASQNDYRACVRLAEEQGIAVYSVWIPIYTPAEGRLRARRPAKGFTEVAEETGGAVFRVGTVQEALNPRAKLDLGPVFEAIIEDLRNQYYLGFYPPDRKQPGFHRIDVRVARKKVKVELRRRGYFARAR